MKFHIMTLFEEMYGPIINTSILKRAIDNNYIEVNMYNIRDFSTSKSKRVDDYVYGGGEGMLMQVEPIYKCYKHIVKDKKIRTIYLSPRGKVFNNEIAKELSKEEELVMLCGHYEGVDKRALILLDAEEISIGDYILTGGELASMVMIDAISRFVDGVLNNENSNKNDSFNTDLLECDQWTRPQSFMGLKVPDVLISGDHKKVEKWKLENAIEITKKNRIDIYQKYIMKNGG